MNLDLKANGKRRPGKVKHDVQRNRVSEVFYVQLSWVKFEEDVEDGGNRWTKPFVGTLSLHALFELRSCILNGAVVLDTPAITAVGVVGAIVQELTATNQLDPIHQDQVLKTVIR